MRKSHQATSVTRISVPAPVEPVVDARVLAVVTTSGIIKVILDWCQWAALLGHTAIGQARVSAVVEIGTEFARDDGE